MSARIYCQRVCVCVLCIWTALSPSYLPAISEIFARLKGLYIRLLPFQCAIKILRYLDLFNMTCVPPLWKYLNDKHQFKMNQALAHQ